MPELAQICPDYARACQLVRDGSLPPIFNDPQFIDTVALALHRSKAAVLGELQVRNSENHQGVVIRRNDAARYFIATSPPASDVYRGLEQVASSFAGALMPIADAAALVIATPSWQRDAAITGAQHGAHFLRLAAACQCPVVVKSVRSGTWVFTATGKTVAYSWRR